MGNRPKSKNWFYELPSDKQAEYCRSLKGTRPSKYCGVGGIPKKPQPKTAEDARMEAEEALKLIPSAKAQAAAPATQAPEGEKAASGPDAYYDNASGHEWAKKSEIKNLGVDLKGAARHKRNDYRSWEDFESYVSEGELPMTKAVLMKNFSPKFDELITVEGADPEKVFFLARALSKFPGKCPEGEGAREAYAGCFRAMAERAETLAKDPSLTWDGARDEIYKTLNEQRKAMGEKYGSYRFPLYFDLRRTGEAIRKNWSTTSARQEAVRAIKDSAIEIGATTAEELSQDRNYRMGELPDDVKAKVASKKEAFASAMKARLSRPAAKKEGGEKRPPAFKEQDWYKNNKSYEMTGPDYGIKSVADAQEYMGKQVKGAQFGNAMPDSERAAHLIAAARSIEDLASVTGLSTNDITLGGKLGVAFGARGSGKAMATYQPKGKIINLTRAGGYGSLAHELGHALDNNILSERGEMAYASEYYPDEASEKGKAIKAVQDISAKMVERIRSTEAYRALPQTSRNYMINRKEVFARSFEAYVEEKLKAKKIVNTYLVSKPGSAFYPTKEETAELVPLFDKLMSAIKRAG